MTCSSSQTLPTKREYSVPSFIVYFSTSSSPLAFSSEGRRWTPFARCLHLPRIRCSAHTSIDAVSPCLPYAVSWVQGGTRCRAQRTPPEHSGPIGSPRVFIWHDPEHAPRDAWTSLSARRHLASRASSDPTPCARPTLLDSPRAEAGESPPCHNVLYVIGLMDRECSVSQP